MYILLRCCNIICLISGLSAVGLCFSAKPGIPLPSMIDAIVALLSFAALP